MAKLYRRALMGELRTWVDKKFIVVMTGMRQVGKTTLFRMLFDEIQSSNKVFLDVENPIVQKAFQEENYDNIWANLKDYGIENKTKAYIFLDEIQAMPEIVKVIKYIFDHYEVQFFATGSSSFYLKNFFPESLAGRKVLLELYPLSFEEFLWFNGIEKEFPGEFREKDRRKNRVSYERTIKFYEEYLLYGGFPRVVLASDTVEKNAVLDDIFTSYFEKDVRSMSDFRDAALLRDLILLLMQRVGSKLNISRISSELSATRTTIYSYLSFLEATYFVNLVTPFSSKVDREISGAKKVYLCDTGILHRFSKVSSGVVLENAVFNALKRLDEVHYYQRRNGKEMDFFLKKKKTGFEVKETGTKYDKQTLRQMKTILDLQEDYVISKTFVPDDGFICASDL
ncbi:MAG: ATP-binding protein [Candidatus Omnitrophica bacterium]|nr:ATP-binding protein [Candidatus Omnitrophota bacterium]